MPALLSVNVNKYALVRNSRGKNAPDLLASSDACLSAGAHGITVHADMPGVTRQGLSIQADRNNLVIEGEASIDLPAGMEALYADVQATRYRRSFALSGELDTERIEATLKDGVLTLTIPKRAEFRPRKIEVRTA